MHSDYATVQCANLCRFAANAYLSPGHGGENELDCARSHHLLIDSL